MSQKVVNRIIEAWLNEISKYCYLPMKTATLAGLAPYLSNEVADDLNSYEYERHLDGMGEEVLCIFNIRKAFLKQKCNFMNAHF